MCFFHWQVFQFSGTDLDEPALVLGHKLVPGSDSDFFCMPASVAVTTSGTIFVADGLVGDNEVQQ